MSGRDEVNKVKKILKEAPKEQKQLNRWIIENVPYELRNDAAARQVISTFMQRRQKEEKRESRRKGL